MANESGDSKTKSSSSSSADSYIGSIISLTSKYEIRYEGVLCYLNPHDSTLGLKNVRSYGTEGRKKDGPEIPPSDKVYEYILFRGSDIKDLQVKSSPAASQAEEPIHNDPAIIQSRSASGPSSLPKLSAVSGGFLTESNSYVEASTLNLKSYPNVVPSNQSGGQVGALGPSQTAQNSKFSSHAMPNQWSEYNLATNDYAYARQQPIPSTTTSFPTLPNFQEVSPAQAPANITLTSSLNSLAPMSSLVASNSIRPSIMRTLSPEQLSTHPTYLLSSSMKSSLSSYPSIIANQLDMSTLHSSGQNGTRIEASEIVNMFSDPMRLQPAQSLSYSTPSLVDSASGSLLKQSQLLLTPDQWSQSRISEHSPAQNLYPDHRDMSVLNPASSDSLYLSTTTAAQASVLPLQPSAQQYTEEFDFDAMNEKFKKDEVWGYLGKARQRDKMERIEENATVCETLQKEERDGLVAEGDSKPAYNKDEFFDTISCNSIGQRVRNGQNRFSERMSHGNETFGNFQQRIQPGYGGYVSGRGGHHREPYNWGRGGYSSGGRGRGGYPRWY